MNDEMIRREEVESLIDRRVALVEGRLTQFKRRVAFSVVAVLAGGFVVSAGHAWAQASCAQTLPSPLVTLCPGAPARAVELNGNNQAMLNWLTQKVGTQGTADVTVTGTTSLRMTALNDQELRLRNPGDATHRLAYTASGFAGTSFDGPVLTGFSGGAVGTNSTGARVAISWNPSGATVNGGLTVTGTGGNVPHACTVRSINNNHVVNCAANEVVTGGGGVCYGLPSIYQLMDSYPENASSWFASCVVWGNAGTRIAPVTTFAVCCAR